MKFFEFIFLKRKLEQDKDNIIQNLETSRKRNGPMWLVLFPEGTGKNKIISLLTNFRSNYINRCLLIIGVVISDNTRLKSKEFADKLHMVIIYTSFCNSIMYEVNFHMLK
jgi:1-acyl-sn-glycerol-3-phosphate acyltransferase